jgi:long-subunit acyl-CoA synthetase (AMP-forming)
VEKIESSYKKLPLIGQIFVYGNSMESVLVAVVVPEEGPFIEAAKKAGLSGSFQELVKMPAAKEMLLNQMNATAKDNKLKVKLQSPLPFPQLYATAKEAKVGVGMQLGSHLRDLIYFLWCNHVIFYAMEWGGNCLTNNVVVRQ